MSADLFITGTDTGVGKTLVSALLCAALDGIYWKPIQTGSEEGTDRRTVMAWAEIPESRTLPETYCFAPPVSPHLAAYWKNVKIDLSRIVRPNGTFTGPLIVEGAGGVRVPVNDTEFILDMIVRLGLPVVVVARSALGTINHTLLTLHALRDAGAPLKGFVMVGPEHRDNEQAVERYGCVPLLGRAPMLEVIDRRSLIQVFNADFDTGQFR